MVWVWIRALSLYGPLLFTLMETVGKHLTAVFRSILTFSSQLLAGKPKKVPGPRAASKKLKGPRAEFLLSSHYRSICPSVLTFPRAYTQTLGQHKEPLCPAAQQKYTAPLSTRGQTDHSAHFKSEFLKTNDSPPTKTDKLCSKREIGEHHRSGKEFHWHPRLAHQRFVYSLFS